jgi:hypothetical protein
MNVSAIPEPAGESPQFGHEQVSPLVVIMNEVAQLRDKTLFDLLNLGSEPHQFDFSLPGILQHLLAEPLQFIVECRHDAFLRLERASSLTDASQPTGRPHGTFT